jgi:hypothetical protein
VYSDAETHLANLDHCGNPALRRAYMTILLAAVAAGYEVSGRADGGIHEMRIRDHAGRQFFAVTIAADMLSFGLRRPALASQRWLAGEAMVRFGDWVTASEDEIAIQLREGRDAERVAEWLFGAGSASRTEISPEYAEHISA